MASLHANYPGDDLVPAPTDIAQRSVDLSASPEGVWPWLVQMGYHRGGWYIDTWWDRAIQRYVWPLMVPKDARGTFRPPLDHIDPSLQDLQIGDIVPDGPPGSAYFTVELLDASRVLALLSTTHIRYLTPKFLWNTPLAAYGEFSWVFMLERLDDGRTRLTLRMRAQIGPRALRFLALPGLRLADLALVREMLLGIKRRVEGRTAQCDGPAHGARWWLSSP
ncbi:hypothetical protein ENSA5_45800 [Enhygromyxa salina]|uniref:SRPBCC family protein n=1 Tax=Enhygromyxa salina TaxID=215803 RepID=A0A2S9XJF8_9BACT|nr:hypothetical protein [Enhygromyxa salina]PRP93019.1 hypothetical protein ENSA5_45800 [Enhygromyxa salina]